MARTMMPKKHETPSSEATVVVSTTCWARWALEKLAKTGRYGETAEDVADELLRAQLRALERARAFR